MYLALFQNPLEILNDLKHASSSLFLSISYLEWKWNSSFFIPEIF